MRPVDYARSLYKHIDIDNPPIEIYKLCKKLDVEIKEDDFIGLDGVTFKSPEYKLIVVSSHLSDKQRRFTIAHELGHIIMPHRSQGIYFHGKNRKMERAANAFASELLMPIVTVKKLWKQYETNPQCRISILADRFDVSYKAMETRVKILGLMRW